MNRVDSLHVQTTLNQESKERGSSEEFSGLGVVSGLAEGPPFFLEPPIPWSDPKLLSDEEVFGEVSRFQRSVDKAIFDLKKFSEILVLQGRLEELKLVESHIALLYDPVGIGRLVVDAILNQKKTAELSLRWVLGQLRRRFRVVCDSLISERFSDVEDVAQRIFEQLKPSSEPDFSRMVPGSILLADYISFSHALKASHSVSALVSFQGSPLSHTAILARARAIPYLVNVDVNRIKECNPSKIRVDGDSGTVVLNPRSLRKNQKSSVSIPADIVVNSSPLISLSALDIDPTVSHESVLNSINLLANIQKPKDILVALQAGITQIGLIRSEYLFSGHLQLQSLPELAMQKSILASCFHPSIEHYVVRALDVSHDKSPFLYRGLRGIQYLLSEPLFFKHHLQAIIEAFPNGCSVLLPFVSHKDEFERAKTIFLKLQKEITGSECMGPYKLGAMIETPAAVFEIDEIVSVADFVSIGSNDLIQSSLGVDRSTMLLPALGALHHGVLELLSLIVQAAEKLNKLCTLCGEVASDQAVLPVLIGLGVNRISIVPEKIHSVRQMLCRMTKEEAVSMAQRAIHTIPQTSHRDLLVQLRNAQYEGHLDGK